MRILGFKLARSSLLPSLLATSYRLVSLENTEGSTHILHAIRPSASSLYCAPRHFAGEVVRRCPSPSGSLQFDGKRNCSASQSRTHNRCASLSVSAIFSHGFSNFPISDLCSNNCFDENGRHLRSCDVISERVVPAITDETQRKKTFELPCVRGCLTTS